MISDTPSPKSTPSGTDATLSRANSVAALRTEHTAGRLRWNWPLVFCFIRFPLLAGCFALAYWAYDITGSEHASALAQAFTRYNAPLLADVIRIGLLLWRLCHEGLSLCSFLTVRLASGAGERPLDGARRCSVWRLLLCYQATTLAADTLTLATRHTDIRSCSLDADDDPQIESEDGDRKVTRSFVIYSRDI
jgi:hypothetical protein